MALPDLTKIYRWVFGARVEIDIPARRTAYLRSLATPDGKKHVLPDLIEYTGVLSPAPPSTNVFAQGRAQGRRDVGLHILENLNLEPAELYAILRGNPHIKPGDFQHGR